MLKEGVEQHMSDYRQQQEQDELMFFLWSSLNALRGHISAEVFQAAERELGFDTKRSNHEQDSSSIH